jgi:hypothetical protein
MRPEPGQSAESRPTFAKPVAVPQTTLVIDAASSSDRRKRRPASNGQRDARVTTRVRARQPKRPRKDRNCSGGQPEGVCGHSHPLSSDSSPGCTNFHRWGIPVHSSTATQTPPETARNSIPNHPFNPRVSDDFRNEPIRNCKPNKLNTILATKGTDLWAASAFKVFDRSAGLNYGGTSKKSPRPAIV